MQLTPINPEDYKSHKSLTPIIRFSTKGPISMNKGATLLLELKAGEDVNFAFGEEEEGPKKEKPLYIYKGTGFTARGKADQCITFNSAKFCTEVLGSHTNNKEAASFQIASAPEEIDGVKYYLIFTIKPFNEK